VSATRRAVHTSARTAAATACACPARGSEIEVAAATLVPGDVLLLSEGDRLSVDARLVYLPPLQDTFHTANLGVPELALLATFPVIVWGSDELRRWVVRRSKT
jgi:hypothetical protein